MNKTFSKNPVVHILILIFLFNAFLMTSGCNILLPAGPLPPTPTSTQTLIPTPTIDWFPATPTPTQAVAASPTPQPTVGDQRNGVAELLIDDDFTDTDLWTTPQSESGNVVYGADNLTLAVAKQGGYLFSLSQYNLRNNFYLEITLQTTLCQPEDQIGIVFWRQSEGDHYQILFNCAGQYRLDLVQGGQVVVVHNWESATQMQPGFPATNLIGIWISQGQFQLYINNTFQFMEQIAQNREGKLGLFARTITGSAMTVRFSKLQIFRVTPE